MPCMGQNHCIPLEQSRLLHADAYRSYLQDTVISELSGKVTLLESKVSSIRDSFSEQLNLEREKNTLQSQNVEGFKSQILSYESENNYLKKREKKARRERNVAIGLGVILLALAVVK